MTLHKKTVRGTPVVTEWSASAEEIRERSALWAEEAQLEDEMLDAIACLPVRQREVMEARYLDGCTQWAAADLLNLTVGQLKILERGACHTLREILG